MHQPGSRQSGLARLACNQNVKKTNDIYTKRAGPANRAKKFNESVTYHHFKMDSLCTITKLIAQNYFKSSIDMKDAYYSIPIRYSDRKFLCFQWDKVLYQFTCLLNGLSCAPRKFTKILKPLLANLHKKGHISVAYLDDLYLQGQTYDQCIANVIDTTLMLEELGFLVHPTKSVLIPT